MDTVLEVEIPAHEGKAKKRPGTPPSNASSLIDMTSFNETPCKIQHIPASKIKQETRKVKPIKDFGSCVEEIQLDYSSEEELSGGSDYDDVDEALLAEEESNEEIDYEQQEHEVDDSNDYNAGARQIKTNNIGTPISSKNNKGLKTPTNTSKTKFTT